MTNPAAAQSQDIDCLSPEAQRLAEARLAAKRAARAEAREIRMKELERQQKEASEEDELLSVGSRGSRVEERPDKEFAEKGARHLPGLSAATLASLGGTSSRRGSGDTSVSLDTEASIREMKDLSDLRDQVQDVEGRCMQGLREMKDSLVEAEDKYRKAMVSNAQLDNEKTNFMYQVDALKDLLLELEEQLAEAQRRHEDKSRELEREKQAHSALRFQFAEVKEALKQRDEMLEKHGIILHSEAATSRETPHTPNNGSCPGPSSVTEEELNALKATGDGTLGRAEAAVAEVGSKFLPGSEQERPPEAPEEPVLPPAQDHTSAASEDGAPSPGTLDRAPAPDAASPDSAAEAEPRGARTPPGAGTGTSPESDGCGGASRDPEAGQGGGQASPSETLSEGVTEEQEGGSPGGAVAREPPESQRAGSTDGGPGAGVEGSPANPTSDMQENQGAGCGGHVASGPAGQEEEERGAITPQELAPSGDPPGAHGEEKSEPCGTVPDSSQKSKNRKKKNRKKKAAAAAANAAKGAEKQLSFESTGSSHAEEDAQGTPGREPGAGAQGQGAETTAQHERADCPEDPSPERDGRDGPGTRDSDTGEATADGDTVSCVGQGAESPATSRAVSSGDGGKEGTSRGHGVPPESEDELDDQGPWEDAVDGPPLEGVAGLSQPVSRQGLESISLDSEDLSPDGEPEGLRPQGQQEAGGGSEMGKSKEDCALC